MTYHVCRLPEGDDDPPQSLKAFPLGSHAYMIASAHNAQVGFDPAHMVYVVPASLMWSHDDLSEDPR